jgi:TolB-like protein
MSCGWRPALRWPAAVLGGLWLWTLALAVGAAPAALPGVVVWDFENQTPAAAAGTGAERSDWLARSLSENLTAALLAVPGLAVVERQRLKDLLAEQKLGSSELADMDTRLQLGRIAGAGRMVFGGYFALGGQVQVNVRIVETATSRVVYSDELTAPAAEVMQQVQALNQRIARQLGGGATLGRGYPSDLWQAYDQALALSDAGRYDEAIAALQRLLAQNKDFAPAERQLIALLDKMSRR